MTTSYLVGDSTKLNWDFLDTVASIGANLIPPPSTPIHQEQDLEDFVTALTSRLNLLLYGQEIRRRKYGDAADEWPPSHTPLELVEKHDTELKALFALMEAASPSDCSDDKQIYLEKKKSNKKKTKKNSQRNTGSDRPDQQPVPRLPTPSPSNPESTPNSTPSHSQSPLLTSDKVASEARRGKKRRLDDTEEDGQHKKSRTVAAEAYRQSPVSGPGNTMAEAPKNRRKKRRLDDTEEGQHNNGVGLAEVDRPRCSGRLHDARLRRGTG